jgi:hypothetical protein
MAEPSEIEVRAGRDAVMQFIDAFFAAPNDVDLECRLAARADEPADIWLVVSIEDAGRVVIRVAFTVAQARALANIAEQMMHEHSEHADAKTMPNLILLLRAGADALERRSAEKGEASDG